MTNNTVLKVLSSFPQLDFVKENNFSILFLTRSKRLNKDMGKKAQNHFKVNGTFKLKLREAQVR